MEWVEVKGPSVEIAIEAALAELGISSPDEVEVEVLQEAEKGFLGIGRTDAVVRVKPIPKKRRRKRSSEKRGRSGQRDRRDAAQKGAKPPDVSKPPAERSKPPAERKRKPQDQSRGGGRQRTSPSDGGKERRAREESPTEKERTVSREEQAAVVAEFLEGLLDAFGLEGTVETRVEEDIIFADVIGSETEALVGSRGAILQAIHELAKTVVQRKTQESARIRLLWIQINQ